MTEIDKINIMIVDDHHMFLEGISSLLNDHDGISVVERANDGSEALAKLAERDDIDVLITDLSMPDVDGFELCDKISTLYPQINILTLSMHSDSTSIKKAIKSGAKGYILKNTGHEQLIEAVVKLSQGENYYSDTVKDNLLAGITGDEPEGLHEGAKLTKREIEILKLIASEYTTQRIADELFISFHTVESHRKNIMRKLNVNNMAGLIRYAIKSGIID